MTVLTVDVNDKKALKALKAVIEDMGLKYAVKPKTEQDVISIPVSEWEEIQKRLNTENFYNEFTSSVKSIKDDIDGKITLKNARDLLYGH